MALARSVRAGLVRAGVPVANYIAGGDGLDVRSDLGTLNLSDIPTVMVELGNMRNPARRPPDDHPARAGGVRLGVAHRDPPLPALTDAPGTTEAVRAPGGVARAWRAGAGAANCLGCARPGLWMTRCGERPRCGQWSAT